MPAYPSPHPKKPGAPAASAPPPSSADAFPPGQRLDLRFAILWKDQRIGAHRIDIRPAEDGTGTAVLTEIEMKVAFGPITMFRFRHRGEEQWRSGGRLWSLKTHTEDHGDVYDVQGRHTPQGIEIAGPLGPYLAPHGLLTSNGLWCRAITRQTRIIDAQNGAVVDFAATPAGDASAAADAFHFAGASWRGEMWYDSSGIWSRAVLHRDGHTLTMQREA